MSKVKFSIQALLGSYHFPGQRLQLLTLLGFSQSLLYVFTLLHPSINVSELELSTQLSPPSNSAGGRKVDIYSLLSKLDLKQGIKQTIITTSNVFICCAPQDIGLGKPVHSTLSYQPHFQTKNLAGNNKIFPLTPKESL